MIGSPPFFIKSNRLKVEGFSYQFYEKVEQNQRSCRPEHM